MVTTKRNRCKNGHPACDRARGTVPCDSISSIPAATLILAEFWRMRRLFPLVGDLDAAVEAIDVNSICREIYNCAR